jgi:hypothetical protein
MAMFTMFQINGDHLEDLQDPNVGETLRNIASNPSNAQRSLEANDLYRVLTLVRQQGDPEPKRTPREWQEREADLTQALRGCVRRLERVAVALEMREPFTEISHARRILSKLQDPSLTK